MICNCLYKINKEVIPIISEEASFKLLFILKKLLWLIDPISLQINSADGGNLYT